jgi:hypothetical protein
MLTTVFLFTMLKIGGWVMPALMLGLGICVSVDHVPEGDDCGPNPGGIVDLYLIRRSDVDTFPPLAADGVTLTGNIVPKTGKGFARWALEMDKAELTHKSVGDPGSQSVEQELEIYISRGLASIDAVMQSCINGKFIVVAVDGLGQKRVGGNLLRPMSFSHDYKGGKKGADTNGTTVKFNGGTGRIPAYYTGTLPLKAA